MKIIYTLILVAITHLGVAQKTQTAVVGFPSAADLSLKTYDKNPNAAAVVLHHRGFIDYKFEDGTVFLYREVHKKIKVFKVKEFTEDAVSMPLYNQDKEAEELITLTAFTHNGYEKTEIKDVNIFTEKADESTTLKKFVFPNIQDGSILEYHYKVKSPFIFSLDKWYFQNSLPTLYSEFKTEIFSNLHFRKKIVGSEYIDHSETSIKKDCFTVSGGAKVDCEIVVNTMIDLPPFIEQKYMLSMKNYILKIDYELESYREFYGSRRSFTKTWEAFDHSVKKEDWYVRELENFSFFKRKIPKELYTQGTDLEKAKALYSYFREHFTWNEFIGLNPSDVKRAFKEKVGSQSQINLSLYNGLKIAGLNPILVFSSSNNNAIPDENEPLFTKLDYLLLRIIIDGKEYFLDASRKELPFGMPHPNALNVKGRVIHFNDQPNFWLPITPIKSNYHTVRTKITATDDTTFYGTVSETHDGYLGYSEKEDLKENGEDAYKRKKSSANTSFNNFTIKNSAVAEEPLKVNYDITVETEKVGNKVLLNPFYVEKPFDTNPFEIENRIYDVYFGYPQSATYLISIDLNDKYTLDKIPENKFFELANKSGSVAVVYSNTENEINIRFNLAINKVRYSPQEYYNLKKLFEEMITLQNDDVIVLKAK